MPQLERREGGLGQVGQAPEKLTAPTHGPYSPTELLRGETDSVPISAGALVSDWKQVQAPCGKPPRTRLPAKMCTCEAFSTVARLRWLAMAVEIGGPAVSETARVQVLLPGDEAERFDAYCKAKGYKKSTLIVRLIREHLDRERLQHQTALFRERTLEKR